MLCDKDLMQDKSLLLSYNSNELPLCWQQEYIDINTAGWCHSCHREVCKGRHDILIPIILSINESHIKKHGKCVLETCQIYTWLVQQKIKERTHYLEGLWLYY